MKERVSGYQTYRSRSEKSWLRRTKKLLERSVKSNVF